MRQIIVVLVLALMCGQSLWAQKEVIDKVVAIVGSELVLLSDIEEQRALMEAQNGALPENARCLILDNMLSTNLLLNQAKLDSVVVTDEEVESQLTARIDRILQYMNGDVSQFEEYYGQSVGKVKEQFREDLKNQLLSERMRGEIMTGITVTPSEVKDFFNKIPKDSLPYFNSEVEIGEIVYYPKINKEERQKAMDELADLRQQIVDGADFAELATKNSDDPGSGRIGGDLGWTKRGTFVPEFEAAAYNLNNGDMSDLVESEFGFHLIQLLDRRGNSIHCRHILIKPEITDDDMDLAARHLDTIRMLVQTDSLSFSRAVKKHSDEDTQSYNNDGRMVNPATGNTFFEIGDLDPDIYFTIDTMEIGSLSAPFEFVNATGETGFRIVQLQSRSKPHKASLKEDYSKIQKAAIESKKSEFVSEWVEERVNSTFITIDGMYDMNTCPNLVKWEKKDTRP